MQPSRGIHNRLEFTLVDVQRNDDIVDNITGLANVYSIFKTQVYRLGTLWINCYFAIESMVRFLLRLLRAFLSPLNHRTVHGASVSEVMPHHLRCNRRFVHICEARSEHGGNSQ